MIAKKGEQLTPKIFQKIISKLDLDIYDYIVNTSGREYMVTCFNKKIFNLIKSYYFEFESGRPFDILILDNILLFI